jgi:hypothetical protein
VGLRLWTLPGGKVKRGESLVKALRRELYEETGLRVEIGSLLGVLDRRDKEFDHVPLCWGTKQKFKYLWSARRGPVNKTPKIRASTHQFPPILWIETAFTPSYTLISISDPLLMRLRNRLKPENSLISHSVAKVGLGRTLTGNPNGAEGVPGEFLERRGSMLPGTPGLSDRLSPARLSAPDNIAIGFAKT